jgi:hypothetical protein
VGNSRGARKLARTPHVNKKKKRKKKKRKNPKITRENRDRKSKNI